MSIGAKTSRPPRPRWHCPVWPNLPVMAAVVILLVVAVAITVTLTVTAGSHTANLASGIIWAY